MSSATTLRAINDMVVGLKADGVWSKITEMYLLSCVTTLNATLVKLKGTGSLTNVNFVSGDYLAVGSGAGLKGNASTKYLNTNLLDTELDSNDKSLGAYITENPTSRSVLIGVGQEASGWTMLYSSNATVNTDLYLPNTDATLFGAFSAITGMHLGSRRGINDVEAYTNGASSKVDTLTASATALTHNYFLFRNNRTAAEPTNARSSFMFFGSGLTDTEALNLSNRVNALMTAIGANVY
jgi:outer membrane murein-binding lipoprotein Lpp